MIISFDVGRKCWARYFHKNIIKKCRNSLSCEENCLNLSHLFTFVWKCFIGMYMKLLKIMKIFSEKYVYKNFMTQLSVKCSTSWLLSRNFEVIIMLFFLHASFLSVCIRKYHKFQERDFIAIFLCVWGTFERAEDC